MAREANTSSKRVVCIAPDSEPGQYGNLTYVKADDLPKGAPDRWELWFGVGMCQLTFPEAYTSPSAHPEAVHAMFAADRERESDHPIGSLERLLEYTDLHAPDWSIARQFTNRFKKRILDIPEGDVMNWQSFFMEPAVNDFADTLRKKGVFQTFHLHEALPDSLHLSPWGRSLLSAMMKVDTVYLHTDEFIRRLKKQLIIGQELGFVPEGRIPEIKRFDLGIDMSLIRQGLSSISRGNYTSEIPAWHDLNHGQQSFIDEVFKTQESVPHRFMCVDRIDPVKGVDVVLLGIEEFLDQRRQAGESPIDLKNNYRFFFLQKAGNAADDASPYNQAAHYNRYVEELFQRIQQKFPGIILRADPLQGIHRVAIAPLMWGCHGITGGTTEGMSLSIMENAKTNADRDTTIVCGSGAGFAMQVKEMRLQDAAEFPVAGQVAEFSSAFHRIVSAKPGQLGRAKDKIVRQAIDPRRDSVIVDS